MGYSSELDVVIRGFRCTTVYVGISICIDLSTVAGSIFYYADWCWHHRVCWI